MSENPPSKIKKSLCNEIENENIKSFNLNNNQKIDLKKWEIKWITIKILSL